MVPSTAKLWPLFGEAHRRIVSFITACILLTISSRRYNNLHIHYGDGQHQRISLELISFSHCHWTGEKIPEDLKLILH